MPFRPALLLLTLVAGSGCTLAGGVAGHLSDGRAATENRRAWAEGYVFRRGEAVRIVREDGGTYLGGWDGYRLAGTDSTAPAAHPRAVACVRDRVRRRCAGRDAVAGFERVSRSGFVQGVLVGLTLDALVGAVLFVGAASSIGR